MNVFLHELKSYRKSNIIWTSSLVLISILFLAMFPSFYKDAKPFQDMINQFPQALRDAIGITEDSFTSILGFYSYIFMYISLTGAIQAMNLGTSLFAKEVRDKTADFLMTKPISRFTIVTSKISAGIVSLVITNILYSTLTFIMALFVQVNDFSTQTFLLISVSLFLLQAVFFSLGVIVSIIIKKIKSVIAVSLSTVFSFFVVSMLAGTLKDKTLTYFTPFKYFEPNYIIQHNSYDWKYLVLGLVVITISIVSSYVIFIKKDIHAV